MAKTINIEITENKRVTTIHVNEGLGPKGKDFKFEDFTPQQLEALRGAAFKYDDFTPAQIEALKVKGDAFVFEDFTPAQLEALRGDAFTYEDFTPAQIEGLKVKGDAFVYEDFTAEQLEGLKQKLTKGYVKNPNDGITIGSSFYIQALKTYLSVDSVFKEDFPYQAIISIKANSYVGDREFFLTYLRNDTSLGTLFQIKEKKGSSYEIVSQIYSPSASPFEGIREIVIKRFGASDLDFTLKANFDLFKDKTFIYTTDFKLNTEYLNEASKIDGIKENKESGIHPINVFGNALPKKFQKKINEMADDIEIVLWGDSLIGLLESCTLRSDANKLPPGCNYNHITYKLWDYICKNKVTADRWDSERVVFTETGSFSEANVSKFNTPTWAGEFSAKTSICKQSNSANAKVSVSWNLDDFEKLNFIGRKTTDGTKIVTIEITEGNNKVEILNKETGVWSEANGSTITQFIDSEIAILNSGISHHVRNWRTKFRRKSGATGIINISMKKGSSTSEYLYYWGIEKWNNNTIHVTNVGRGGRDMLNLGHNFINDVIERKPDLVMLSAPLANEYNTSMVNLENRYINLLTNTSADAKSLKSFSNNFNDFQVVVFIPHGRSKHWNGNRAIKFTPSLWETNGQLAYYNYERIKQIIIDNLSEGINVIDLGKQLYSEAYKLGMTNEQSLTGSNFDSEESFTKDGIHTNNYGAKYWLKYLGGIFNN